MAWTIRAVVAMALWVAAGLLAFFLLFSGWWLFAPFAFAGGGGQEILVLILAIVALAIAAHLLGRRPAG